MLEELGILPHVVSTGAAAVEAAGAADLVILAAQLPDMAGLTALRFARKRRPDLTCLVVGSRVSLTTASHALDAGAFGFISRESPPPAIAASLHRAVHHIRMERENALLRSLNELVVAHLPAQVLVLDGEGRVTAMTGSPGGVGTTVGLPLRDSLAAGLWEAASLKEHLPQALAEGREVVLPRIEVGGAQPPRTFSIHLVPLQHRDARCLVHVEDVSETVATEARLRRAESLAQVGALAAAVAHEIRNPLAGISGTVQVLTGTLPEEDRRRPVLGKVQEQILRLDRLVTDLLLFARPMEPRPVDLDLGAVARQAVELLRRDRHMAQTDLEVVGSAPLRSDHQLLTHILINLMLNAAAAAGPGGRVRIEARQVEDRASLTVCDSGPGVPEELKGKIFEPFFTTRARGTGLGLAICTQLATSLGGSLTLISPGPLGGACFRIEFDLLHHGKYLNPG